jgi:hypothetical protein
MAREASTSAPARRWVQKAAAAARGKARVDAPTWRGTITVARPMVRGRITRNPPPTARKAAIWANHSGGSAKPAVSSRRAPVYRAATATTRACTRAVPIQRRPTTLWSPVPRIPASPLDDGAETRGGKDAGAVVGASSVTVMQAPGWRDGSGSGI